MKKLLLLALSVCLIGSLIGCGTKPTATLPESETPSVAEPEPPADPEETEAPSSNEEEESEASKDNTEIATTELYLVDDSGLFASDEQYFPVLVLKEDGTFLFVVNLFEGMGEVSGKYNIDGDTYSFEVTERNFGGFVGDDVNAFTLTREGDTFALVEDLRIGSFGVETPLNLRETPPASYNS